jgi:NADPH:quinone reductase-like Zn-dependent oxidoreductase
MKAIVRDTYGSPDVLEFGDIDKPEIGDDEVLVRVHAAGVDRGVWHVMTGLPYPIRLAGYGLRAPKNLVIGSDVAGRTVARSPRICPTLPTRAKVRSAPGCPKS